VRPRRRPLRVLVAKPGLDGHDKGAKVIAAILRDAGCEVIYTGLHQTPADVARAAVQEDVDVVGLSFLSGVHLALTAATIELLRAAECGAVVVVGGNIPTQDILTLKELGVTAVFPGGTSYADIVTWFDAHSHVIAS